MKLTPTRAPKHLISAGAISNVNVAQRASTHRVGDILDLDRVGQRRDDEEILNCRVGARGPIQESPGAKDTLAVVEVEHLPDPVDTVDLGVVQPEGGVVGRDEGVAARIATNGEVTATVYAHEVGRATWVAAHLGRELKDVGRAEDELRRVAERRPLLGDARVQVAPEAAGVVELGLGVEGDVRGAVLREHDRAEVERQVGKGARLDAATTRAGREHDRDGRGGQLHDQAGMRDGLAITAERRVGSIEDGRVAGRLYIEAPLPVGEVAVVAALVQFLLVDVDEVTVPREKVSLGFSQRCLAPGKGGSWSSLTVMWISLVAFMCT